MKLAKQAHNARVLRLFAGCLAAGAAVLPLCVGAASNNNWKKVDGDANGSMSEDAHWTSGARRAIIILSDYYPDRKDGQTIWK